MKETSAHCVYYPKGYQQRCFFGEGNVSAVYCSSFHEFNRRNTFACQENEDKKDLLEKKKRGRKTISLSRSALSGIQCFFASCTRLASLASVSKSSAENCRMGVKCSTSVNLSRPFKPSSSMITNVSTISQPSDAHSFCAAPSVPGQNENHRWRSTLDHAGSVVPPVASRSSTRRTLVPGWRTFVWISIVSLPKHHRCPKTVHRQPDEMLHLPYSRS